MKNLSLEDITSLNEKNVLEYLYSMYPFAMESLQDKKLCAFISFKICESFLFKVYAPTDIHISETEKVKVHIYETISNGKYQDGGYQILNIRKDDRFTRTSWQELFSDDWYSAGVVNTKQLLDMMKFAARLCRLRVFE